MKWFTIRRLTGTAWRILRNEGPAGLFGAVFDRIVGASHHAWYAKKIRVSLEEHLDSEAYVVISTVQWEYPYKQRPQHLARALGEEGARCVYVAPSYNRRSARFGSEVEKNVFVYYEKKDIPRFLGHRHTVLLLSTDNTIDQRFIGQLKTSGATIVYDYIDVIDEAISRHAVSDARMTLHDRLLRDPRIVCLASAETLYKEVLGRRSGNLILLTNGVEYPVFANVRRNGPRPTELGIIPAGRTVIGYYGALAAWLDYELINETALLRRDDAFVLIGPNYDGSASTWYQRMPENIFALPPVAYDRLPKVAVWFDVCMVPFVRSELTDAISPLKLFEYMSMGKPIISTDFVEVRKYPPILTVESPDEFAEAIDQGLRLSQNESYVAECRRIARSNSWTAKVHELLNHVNAKPQA